MEAKVRAEVGVLNEGINPARALNENGWLAWGVVAEILLNRLPDQTV
jgi:hypothetical protein